MIIYGIKFNRDIKDFFETKIYLVKKYKNKKYYLESKNIINEKNINRLDSPRYYYNYVLSERDIKPMKIAILKRTQKEFIENIAYKNSEIKNLSKILDEIKNILKALENKEE